MEIKLKREITFDTTAYNELVPISKEIKECIEKDECCSSILKEIALIKNELDSMSKVILEGHIRNCLVRDIKLGLEEKVVDDFLYTINKMIK